MFIERIKLENFGNVESQELFFNEGITVFSGENGEGKSTVLRAVSMGLFNRFPLTLKDYIRWGQDSFTIEIDFSHLGNSYEFVMTYDGGTTRHLECVNTKDEWAGSSVVEHLDSILDLKRAVASTISFEHEIDLITTNPSERREYLKGVYDLNFRKQLNIIEGDIAESQTKIEQLRGEIISLEAQEFELVVLDRLPFSEEKYNTYQETKARNEKEITLYEEKMKNLQELKSSLENREYQLYRKNNQKKEEEESVRSLKDSKQKQKDELAGLPEDVDLKEIEESFDKSKLESESELKKTKERIDFLNNKIDELNKETVDLEKVEDEVSAELNKKTTLKHMVETSKKNLETFEKGICPVCEQEIDKSDLSRWEKELEDNEAGLEEVNQKLDILYARKQQLLDLSKESEEYQHELYSLTSTIKVHESKIESLEQEKEREISFAREKLASKKGSLEKEIESLKSRVKDKIASVVYIEDEIKELEGEVSTLKNKISESDAVSPEVVTEKKMELEDTLSKIKLYDETKVSNQEKKSFNERIEKNRKERDELVIEKQKNLDNLETDNTKFQLARKIFAREFPAFVLSQLVRNLEVSVNEFLSRVYPHYDISIEESRNSLKIMYGENKSDVKMASGFEKQIFSFAYKYALGKLQDYQILFLDEVDSAASVTNSRKFYETIGRMDSYFKQLFVITHKEEIKELLSNDYQASVYQVEKGTYSLI